MSKLLDFRPDRVSHPGNTIYDILRDRAISTLSFADMMNMPMHSIEALLEGSLAITEDIAYKLSDSLGASQEFWVRRENQFQNIWLNMLPVKDMVRLGWIPTEGNRYSECLNYFDVNNVPSWQTKYELELKSIAFRTSQALEDQPASIAAWIRQGEIQTQDIECQPWDVVKFKEALSELRVLTRQSEPQQFIPAMQSVCASCGVAVGVVRTPSGCFASGATKFVTPTRAMLLLSFRYLSDDHFWFTFFHEAGHLILHGINDLFIEGKEHDPWDEREQEANDFSANILIPQEYRQSLMRLRLEKFSIARFARDIGVSPGIVVGQLQHSKRIRYKDYNKFKRRYKWD